MRALVWPTYSYAGNVGADSLYLIARNLIRASKVGEFDWVLVVPDLSSVPVDDLDSRPDVQKVRVPMAVLYRAQEAVPDADVIWDFAPTDGKHPVDVLVSMSPARTLNVANAWSMRCPSTAKPLLVNWDLLVRDDRSGEMVADEPELLQQAAGGVVADLNVHESPIARKMALDVARKHMSAANVRRLIESSVDVPQGIPVDRLMDAIKDVPKREKFAVYYGGRFSTSKRINELADVADAFYRYGRDVQFVVTTGSLDGNKRAKFEARFPQTELHIGLPQEEAWKVMASCHASICFSSHELFGMAFWEQMAAGLQVVMQAANWNADLLPPEYPWVCQGPMQAGAMLRQIHDQWRIDPSLWASWQVDRHATWVREQYDSEKNCRQMLDLIRLKAQDVNEKAFEAYEGGSRRELVALARQVLAEDGRDDECGFDEYLEALRGASRVGRNVVGYKIKWAKSHATLDALRVARYLGWDDAGRGLLARRKEQA